MDYERLEVILLLVFMDGFFLLGDSTLLTYIIGFLIYFGLLIVAFFIQTINLEIFLTGLVAPPIMFIIRALLREFRQQRDLICPRCKEKNAGEKVHESTLGFFERPIYTFTGKFYHSTSVRYAKIRIDFRCKYCGEDWSVTFHERI